MAIPVLCFSSLWQASSYLTSARVYQVIIVFPLAGKHQFVRKDSADSGISAGSSSRKTSTMSSISASSISEAPEEDCIKEETPFEEPDDDLCEKITQQVCPFLF